MCGLQSAFCVLVCLVEGWFLVRFLSSFLSFFGLIWWL